MSGEQPAAGHKYSEYFYNPITMAGILIVFLVLLVEAVLWVTDHALKIDSPYFGMIMWMILPPVLVFGVILIPAGAWWTRRQILRNPDATVLKSLRIDFSNPVHRNTTMAFLAGIVIFLVLSSAGLYHTYHYTESVSFCGEVCHQVMKPEFTVYQTSAHARVKCASCHIGSGAGWFAKSKISGSYQVYAVLMGKYPRPIPTPIKNLRPAQETCEQCHWPQQFYSPKERTYPHFKSDEKNTPAPTRVIVNVGGGIVGKSQTGIHLHMNINHLIEYIPKDESREEIVWVRSTDRVTGEVKEFRSASAPPSDSALALARVRRMDCMDCHNRPAHKFASPQAAVNDALEAGALDRGLPYIKREAVKSLDREYAAAPQAMSGIAAHLRDFYAESYPDLARGDPKRVTAAILAVQELYKKSQFPEMRASWKSYPDHIGHLNSPGCFRCHNDDLVSTGNHGKKMTRDCNTCHSFLKLVGEGGVAVAQRYTSADEYDHPGDVGDMWKETNCHECHKGGAELY